MSSLNKVMIIGNLGSDPEVRYTQSNIAVANLSVATTEKFKDNNGELNEKTEWHRVTLWANQAEIAQKYLKQGSKVFIEGSIHTREWEDKEGIKRYSTEIKGYRLVMLTSQGQSSGNRPPQPPHPGDNQPAPQTSQSELSSEFDDMDDDLPF
jgi:single-strand DNA-binding protein